mmetsp:Transcript_40999/g.64006  ORF Transcript_40999/g.64006 Transcript_40999/m.64006 type:complete len:410 (+) Transcript_40999:44-1273(+)
MVLYNSRLGSSQDGGTEGLKRLGARRVAVCLHAQPAQGSSNSSEIVARQLTWIRENVLGHDDEIRFIQTVVRPRSSVSGLWRWASQGNTKKRAEEQSWTRNSEHCIKHQKHLLEPLRHEPVFLGAMSPEEMISELRTGDYSLAICSLGHSLRRLQRAITNPPEQGRELNVPVLVLRDEDKSDQEGGLLLERRRKRRIAVGVHSSEECLFAFQWAADRVFYKDDEIILIHVKSPTKSAKQRFSGSPDSTIEEGKPLYAFGKWCEGLGLSCIKVEVEGDPTRQFCEWAKFHLADLCILGSRGMNWVQRTMVGSVSSYAVKWAHCPVLVVGRPTFTPARITPQTAEKFVRLGYSTGDLAALLEQADRDQRDRNEKDPGFTSRSSSMPVSRIQSGHHAGWSFGRFSSIRMQTC